MTSVPYEVTVAQIEWLRAWQRLEHLPTRQRWELANAWGRQALQIEMRP